LSEEEFQQIEELAKSHTPKRVCDQSSSQFSSFPHQVDNLWAGFEPFYDIYQEADPNFSDKAMYAKHD